jgi:hypothetical protein
MTPLVMLGLLLLKHKNKGKYQNNSNFYSVNNLYPYSHFRPQNANKPYNISTLSGCPPQLGGVFFIILSWMKLPHQSLDFVCTK